MKNIFNFQIPDELFNALLSNDIDYIRQYRADYGLSMSDLNVIKDNVYKYRRLSLTLAEISSVIKNPELDALLERLVLELAFG